MAKGTEERLIQAIRKQTEKVTYFCLAENVLPDLTIHEIRKSFKRIRALLKFFPESVSETVQNYAKQIGGLAKLLTLARESTVNLQLFDKLCSESKLFTKQKCKELRVFFANENKRQITELISEKNILFKIKSFINDFETSLLRNLADPAVKIDVLKQIYFSYDKGYNLFSEIGKKYDAVKYHKLRKVMKTLLYQLEFAKVDQPKYFKLKANTLRKIAEELGYDHDLFIFQSEIKNKIYNLNIDELRILEKQIKYLQESNFHKLFPRLKTFFKESPASFEKKIRLEYRF